MVSKDIVSNRIMILITYKNLSCKGFLATAKIMQIILINELG